MRVHLHIGGPETGIAAIEWVLARNTALLEASGVLYPLAGRSDGPAAGRGHDPLARAVSGSPGGDDCQRELRRELDSSPLPAAVLSSAEFRRLDRRPQLAALRELLDGHEVAVIAYLRRQDEAMHAGYCAAVLSGTERRPFSEFRRGSSIDRGYARILRPWERAFGREAVRVRPCERGQLAGEDVISDLAEQLGVAPAAELERPPPGIGERSYPRNVIESVRRLRLAGAGDDLIAGVVEICAQVYDGAPLTADIVAPQRRAEMLKRFQESNGEVARRYLGRPDGRLFDDLAIPDQDAWQHRYRRALADVTVSIDDAQQGLAELLAGPLGLAARPPSLLVGFPGRPSHEERS